MNKLILIALLALIIPFALAANPGHTAASVSPGTFVSGGAFTFPEQLNVDGNFIINTDALFVNATSGNVGIGTTNPQAGLDVVGNIRLGGSNNSLQFDEGQIQSPSFNYMLFESAGFLQLNTNTDTIIAGNSPIFYITNDGSTRLSLNANGNFFVDSNVLYVDAVNDRVGIGTNTPNATLDVVGDISVNNNNVTEVDCIVFASGGEICSA